MLPCCSGDRLLRIRAPLCILFITELNLIQPSMGTGDIGQTPQNIMVTQLLVSASVRWLYSPGAGMLPSGGNLFINFPPPGFLLVFSSNISDSRICPAVADYMPFFNLTFTKAVVTQITCVAKESCFNVVALRISGCGYSRSITLIKVRYCFSSEF